MWNYPIKESFLGTVSKHAKIAGVVFIILGIIGIIFPVFMTLVTVTFVAWLMLAAGLMAGYFTYLGNPKDYLGWLKSVILVGVALLMFFYSMNGAGTVGLLFTIYFFMDAFAGFGIASTIYPNKGWWAWLINALISFTLGVIFIIGWPFSSLYLVGIFVGFSLFFDGIVLLFTGSLFHKMDKGL